MESAERGHATTSAGAGVRPDGSARGRRLPCAGDANALRAITLLGRWNRAARMQAMFAGSCACCVGDAQIQHMERQLIDYLYERRRQVPPLESLLRDCKAIVPGDRQAASSPVATLMRRIATEQRETHALAHADLLNDLEDAIQSLE